MIIHDSINLTIYFSWKIIKLFYFRIKKPPEHQENMIMIHILFFSS